MIKFSNIKPDNFSLEFSSLAREKNQNNDKIISFGLGEPYFKPPDKLVKLVNKAINNGFNRYCHPQGLLSLRQQIAKKYSFLKENIVITAGAKPALSILLKILLHDKDEIIFFEPCFPSYRHQIHLANPKAKFIRFNLTKNFSINFSNLKKKINKKTKIILINSPHNPTGQVINEADFEDLLKLAKKHKFYIIIDGVYNDLIYKPYNYNYLDKNIIYFSSFSKVYGITGWRIGYLHSTNQQIINACKYIQMHVNTNTNTFLQKAISDYLKNDDFKIKFRSKLQKKTFLLEKIFKKNQIQINIPMGGFFAFICIKETNLMSDDFAFLLLKKYDVAVTPGVLFGKKWDNYVRICFAVNNKDFNQGINKFIQFYNEKKTQAINSKRIKPLSNKIS